MRLFLYGTLMPGHDAWHLVEAAAGEVHTASAAGVLYDTGRGYPAVVFADDGTVHGVVVDLDASAAPAMLARLDRYEGPEYRRIRVETSRGPADAYDWIGPRAALTPVDGGRWPKPDAAPADQ